MDAAGNNHQNAVPVAVDQHRQRNDDGNHNDGCCNWSLVLAVLVVVLGLMLAMVLARNNKEHPLIQSSMIGRGIEKFDEMFFDDLDNIRFDEKVFLDNVTAEDWNKRQQQFKEEEKTYKESIKAFFYGFVEMLTGADSESEAKEISKIEEQIFQIFFRTLKQQDDCNVFKGVHVDHYPGIVKNIAKRLRLPDTMTKSLLQAVSVKQVYEQNFNSFNIEGTKGTQIFGRFSVRKLSDKWIALVYTIKSLKYEFGGKETQLNQSAIADLVAFDQDGSLALTFKAQKDLGRYFFYQSQKYFNSTCMGLLES